MVIELKSVKGEDAKIQKRDLAVSLVQELKQCSRDYAERMHGELIAQYEREEVYYLVGRLEGQRLHQLQLSKDNMEALLRLLSWYGEHLNPTQKAAIKEVYLEAMQILESVNRTVALHTDGMSSVGTRKVPR